MVEYEKAMSIIADVEKKRGKRYSISLPADMFPMSLDSFLEVIPRMIYNIEKNARKKVSS